MHTLILCQSSRLRVWRYMSAPGLPDTEQAIKSPGSVKTGLIESFHDVILDMIFDSTCRAQ